MRSLPNPARRPQAEASPRRRNNQRHMQAMQPNHTTQGKRSRAAATRVIMRVDGIPIYWNGSKAWFTAGMTIDADGSPICYHPDGSPPGLDYLANAGRPGNWWALATDNKQSSGRPIIQRLTDPAPGFFVSMTSYKRRGYEYRDPKRYLDSGATPFIVIPAPLISTISPIFMGCECEAINMENGLMSVAVCGDAGPKNHLGEGSMALARNLGLRHDPKRGGTSRLIIQYTLYPGTPAVVNGEAFPLQPTSQAAVAMLAIAGLQ